jgi:hypothetical protein
MRPLAVMLIGIALPSQAMAQAWTKDAGHAYLSLNLMLLSGDKAYGPDFTSTEIASTYSQTTLGFYSELGVIDRWLTMTANAELYRRNALADQGATSGLGDLRIGAWTGILTGPFVLTAGAWLGLPTGDPEPSAGSGADAEAELIAKSLPTGDGEVDLEPTILFGHGFGGGGWPFTHWVVASLGWTIRTKGFSDGISYRLELGTRLSAFDRAWFSVRLFGVESFASDIEAGSGFAGLGNGVTYTSLGAQLGVRVAGGLSVAVGGDTAFRARSIIAAIPIRFSLAYEL